MINMPTSADGRLWDQAGPGFRYDFSISVTAGLVQRLVMMGYGSTLSGGSEHATGWRTGYRRLRYYQHW